MNNSFRANNSVKYTSANYAGLKFGGLYGFWATMPAGPADNRDTASAVSATPKARCSWALPAEHA